MVHLGCRKARICPRRGCNSSQIKRLFSTAAVCDELALHDHRPGGCDEACCVQVRGSVFSWAREFSPCTDDKTKGISLNLFDDYIVNNCSY